MNKPLHFTAHAKTVISERSLDLKWIERTVHSPEWNGAKTTHPDHRWNVVIAASLSAAIVS